MGPCRAEQNRSGIAIAMAGYFCRSLYINELSPFVVISGIIRKLFSMAGDKLASIPDVEIDPSGTFKYVLIQVYGSKKGSDTEEVKTIVRGFKWGAYHADIYDNTLEALQAMGLDTECVGGGRIKHEPEKKKILVYGYSQGFGKADHSISVALLKKKYSDYDITWSDEGY